MDIGEWIALVLGLPAFLGAIFWLVNKLIRGSLLSTILKERDNIIKIMVKDKTELREQINSLKEELKELITQENKNTMKYIGNACDEKLQDYERINAKIRESRQEMYNQNIEYMKSAIKDISVLLSKFSERLEEVQKNINNNALESKEHTMEIKQLRRDIDDLKRKGA